MECKVILLVQSQLSDVNVELFVKLSDPEKEKEINSKSSMRIEFVKFLLAKYSDTNTEIDPDEEYDLFSKE